MVVAIAKTWQGRSSESRFHEGRGAGKIDPRGSRKACLFLKRMFRKRFAEEKIVEERMGWMIRGRIGCRGRGADRGLSFRPFLDREGIVGLVDWSAMGPLSH